MKKGNKVFQQGFHVLALYVMTDRLVSVIAVRCRVECMQEVNGIV